MFERSLDIVDECSLSFLPRFPLLTSPGHARSQDAGRFRAEVVKDPRAKAS